MSETVQMLAAALLFIFLGALLSWAFRQIVADSQNATFDRLVLDAVEQLGPEVTMAGQIYPYVSARRFGSSWSFTLVAIHQSLIRLEVSGLVESEWATQLGPGEQTRPRTRVYSAKASKGRTA